MVGAHAFKLGGPRTKSSGVHEVFAVAGEAAFKSEIHRKLNRIDVNTSSLYFPKNFVIFCVPCAAFEGLLLGIVALLVALLDLRSDFVGLALDRF